MYQYGVLVYRSKLRLMLMGPPMYVKALDSDETEISMFYPE